mgnify:FL=1
MESKIYFTVKVLCTIFIFYQLWIFIFSRQMYEAWEKVYRMMRIARIKLWKRRKEYRIYREKKVEKAREKNRRKKKVTETKVAQENPETVAQSSPADDNDVIGKTKIVYLEDPEVARKKPTRSEPLVKEPIEEDEEISPDDVVHEDRGLTKEEMEALMVPVDAEPDPEFNTAMTFEEMNNVVEVLTSETQDKQKDFRASMTIYHKLSGTEILNLLENEIGCQQKIESLLNEYLDETGRPLAKRKIASKKMEAFNIDKFV